MRGRAAGRIGPVSATASGRPRCRPGDLGHDLVRGRCCPRPGRGIGYVMSPSRARGLTVLNKVRRVTVQGDAVCQHRPQCQGRWHRIAWPHALWYVIPSKGGACCVTALCSSTMAGSCSPAPWPSSLQLSSVRASPQCAPQLDPEPENGIVCSAISSQGESRGRSTYPA